MQFKLNYEINSIKLGISSLQATTEMEILTGNHVTHSQATKAGLLQQLILMIKIVILLHSLSCFE